MQHKGPNCLVTICQTCLTRNHRGEGHDVMETEEREREALLEKINVITNGLQERKKKIVEVQKNAENINSECVQKMTARKDKLIQMINQQFEEMLEEVREKGQNDVAEKLTTIEEHSNFLKNIKENMDKEVITHQEIQADMEKVTAVEQNIKDHLSGMLECKVFEMKEFGSISEDVKRLYGRPEEGTKYVDMNGYSWKVVSSLWTGMANMCFLAPIDENCIAILNDTFTYLIKYRWSSGEKIQKIQLDSQAKGIVAVKLACRPCLAVTYEGKQKIEFRDAKDLNTVVLEHSVAPHAPRTTCASSNCLWFTRYDDFSKLDCSSSPCLTQVKILCREVVYDMCCAELEDNPLLVVVCGYSGVKAYNTSTEKVEWSVQGEIPLNEKCSYARSITTDDHGRLFVLDERNKCVHIFSVMGKYITTILRKRERGLGELRKIRWSEGMSGLIVVYGNGRNTKINLIKIQS